ncbi:Ubiquitin carboxyl-terminal hydrolase 48 [Entomortierella lignicola]|nr:Ubiquitin carboxyl-terminal hydrolase 48 [Entomortierella lignicola]
MTSFGKKSGKQWHFLGQEVKSLEDLTPTHIRAVYGLGPGPKTEMTIDPKEEVKTSQRGNTHFPYCANRYTNPSLESSERNKGNSACSVARCKDGNPHCLNHMGQDQWEKEDALDKYFDMITIKSNPEILKRPIDTPAGMKNLGATCYANSLLQVWFHDLAFRDAIYRCRFSEDVDKTMNALYQLQLLFLHLDKGIRTYYNPLSLVKSLKLDTAMQQDAQEFCNLFMARIDNQLQNQQDPWLGGFIRNQFQGHYSYNTTCSNCKKTSVRGCTFYELMLNIKDNCTLMDCLEEFVEPEKLEGADRYSCSTCGSLQDASREIKLDKLPNVLGFPEFAWALNIQLMRFVYDSTTWTKKKSKDTIKFPPSIDFSELLRSNESAIYDLSAVLVHSGSSAHSGHFLAHVLNKENNKWFLLNDEEVTEFHGTKFDPEEFSETDSKAKSKKTTSKGDAEAEKFLRASDLPRRISSPPNEMLSLVEQDNSQLDNEIQEFTEYKEKIKMDFDRLRNKHREIYSCWEVNCDEDDGYYLSSDALATYIKSKNDPPQILDNSSLACEHGKLCPLALIRSKLISKAAMKIIEDRDQVKVNPVLSKKDYCDICIRTICQDKLYTLMHRKDAEEFDRKAKGIRSPPAVWVSKSWITDWSKVSPKFHPSNGTTADDPSPVSEGYVSDVFCPHGSLSTDKTKRKLINEAASCL